MPRRRATASAVVRVSPVIITSRRPAAFSARIAAGVRVLDVGCGTGQPALLLARETGARVTGVNIGREQIELARANAARAGLGDLTAFHRADAADLPFRAGVFDAVLMIETLSHLPDKAGALRGAARCLRPGGRILADAPLVHTPARNLPPLDARDNGMHYCPKV